jgi:hypothetical protein
MKTLVCSLFLMLPTLCYAQHPDHTALVAMVKQQLVSQGEDLSGACGGFKITKRVAWALRNEGAGLLSKPSGNNCDAYSVDYIFYPDGLGYDILGDAGGANTPSWGGPDAIDASRYRPAVDPGTGDPAPPTVPVPTPPPTVDLKPITDRLSVLEQSLANLANLIQQVTADIQNEQAVRANKDTDLSQQIDGVKARPIFTGCTVQFLRCRLETK